MCAAVAITWWCSAGAAVERFATFSMDIPDGWEHSSEHHRSNSEGFGATVRVSQPGSSSKLQIVSYSSPVSVTEELLRNFTNVDITVDLELESWGEFSGYRYVYSEGSGFFRQWWLARDATLLILVFESERAATAEEIRAVDAMVASLAAPAD